MASGSRIRANNMNLSNINPQVTRGLAQVFFLESGCNDADNLIAGTDPSLANGSRQYPERKL
jgi:hypothetical protein